MRNTEHVRARRAALVAAGKCIDCRDPADGAMRCKPCRDQYRDRERDRRAARKAAGVCVVCKVPSLTTHCPPCNTKTRAMQDAWRAAHPGYFHSHRLSRAAMGLCHDCNQPRVNGVRCEACAARNRERMKVAKAAKRKADRAVWWAQHMAKVAA